MDGQTDRATSGGSLALLEAPVPLPLPIATRSQSTNSRSAVTIRDATCGADNLGQIFETFYANEIESLVRALSATLIEPSLAADAAHEAMTRAYERWDLVGQHPNPTAWCYRVATNWTTSRWRKRRREVVVDPFEGDRPIHGASSAASLNHVALNHLLCDALMRLDVDQRAVVVLRLCMDWSREETADALGIPVGTVGSRLSRALAKLRVALGDIEL